MKEKTNKKRSIKQVSCGVCELFVVASIAFMTVIIWMGTEGYTAKVLTLPAVAWAVVTLLKRFAK